MKKLAIAFVLATTPAHAAVQFDLLCNETEDPEGAIPKKTVHEYRVDLLKKKYCEDACSDGLTDISSYNDHYIIFTDLKTGDLTAYFAVDRVTGDITARIGVGSDITNTTGRCEPRPFKAFPRLNTKF